jgi:hypothetical protein
MAKQIRNPNERGGFVWILSLIAISLAASGVCRWAAGSSLGLFFGGLFVVTFLMPAGVLGSGNLRQAFIGLAAVAGPVAIVWLNPVQRGSDTPGEWAQSVLVLATYSVAIGGIALVLERARWPVVFAAALSIFLGLAWLAWPIWLPRILVNNGLGGVVRKLVAVSPPLTINGILTGEPAWTERSLAYHLTDLNQDVPIELPVNAVPCAAMHGLLGLVLWSAAMAWPSKSAGRRFENVGNPLE